MIGSLIGAGIGAVGSIFGGIKASEAMREVKRGIEQQRKKNQDWYDRRYNEDATQRADAQRALEITREQMKRRNRAAAGTQAVMGGTEEAAAATREANNELMADTVSRIAADGEARKDSIEQQYRQRDAQLEGQLQNLEAGRAANIAQAVKGVSAAGASLADAFEDLPAKAKKETAL